MGSSGWMYIISYNSDIQLALNTLREEVFQKGNYYIRPAWNSESVSLIDLLPQNASEEDKEALTQQYHSWKQEQQPASFHSISELLAWNGESETHSILDVHTISTIPLMYHTIAAMEDELKRNFSMDEFTEIRRERAGKVYPLMEEQLLSFFGTSAPERQHIMQHIDELYELRDKGVGTYIVLYRENWPKEILFIGRSGD